MDLQTQHQNSNKREQNEHEGEVAPELSGRTACVIGYGKLGRSIAHLLHARHVRTVVYDCDPIRQVEAMSHGFPVGGDLRKALCGAGLVICATGNLALRRPDFSLLDNGAYVATVTSSDDELEIGDLHYDYGTRQGHRPHGAI
jgi:adenosylhomocysteinase